MKDDGAYVDHVLDCIRRIKEYCRDGETPFRESELIQDGVMRNLQTMAESTQRMSDDVRALHPEVDWRAMRDSEMSWSTITWELTSIAFGRSSRSICRCCGRKWRRCGAKLALASELGGAKWESA